VQIGITLVGVLSGAFSGATLGARCPRGLARLSQGAADALGVGAVVTLITYASLIIGELVPKQIALRDPGGCGEGRARHGAALENIAAAGVDFGSLRQGAAVGAWPAWRSRKKVSEEIHTLVVEAENAGVLEPGERK
jgi:putative hemolysin